MRESLRSIDATDSKLCTTSTKRDGGALPLLSLFALRIYCGDALVDNYGFVLVSKS